MDGAPVKLHVYDIANTDNENLNSFLKFVNNVSREVRAGGIYHGAIEVYGYEYSFGYCPTGSGVYKMKPTTNKMYTYRESLELGTTVLSEAQFRTVLKELQEEFQGSTYDLLTRWLNRFAYGADVTLTATNNAYSWMKGCAESTASLWRSMTSGAPTVQSLPSSEQQKDPKAEKEKLIQASKPTFAVPSDLPSD